jgi:hypothetical protein
LRDVYEQILAEQAAKMSGFFSLLSSKQGQRMTQRERNNLIRETGIKQDMQLPGVQSPLLGAVAQGPDQLEVLTKEADWCMAIVDIKMTTTQTRQGKKSQYSAMVLVGNLEVRYSTGPFRQSKFFLTIASVLSYGHCHRTRMSGSNDLTSCNAFYASVALPFPPFPLFPLFPFSPFFPALPHFPPFCSWT